MCLKNTAERFGFVAQGFHWVIGLLIIGMLALGFYMADLEPGPEMLKLYGLHKSFGALVLMLVILRIIWRLMNVTPSPLAGHARWEVVLAKSVQGILYLAMLSMPLSGWLLSSSAGYPVSFFGLFDLPALVGKSKPLHDLAEEIHEITAFVLIGALTLHIAGALKHHIIDRDETIARMLPWTKPTKPTE